MQQKVGMKSLLYKVCVQCLSLFDPWARWTDRVPELQGCQTRLFSSAWWSHPGQLPGFYGSKASGTAHLWPRSRWLVMIIIQGFLPLGLVERKQTLVFLNPALRIVWLAM